MSKLELLKKTPLYFHNSEIENLEDNFRKLLLVFNEFAKEKGLEEDIITEIKIMLARLYLKRKMGLFIDDKLSHFNDCLINLCENNTITNTSLEDKSIDRFYYYKKKRHVKHEY